MVKSKFLDPEIDFSIIYYDKSNSFFQNTQQLNKAIKIFLTKL